MKALVLIGGFGTRLRPVTYHLPKQLIPIAGKPMLYHVLDLLPPEVDEAVFATGYKAEVVEAFVREHPARIKVHSVPESVPLGTGGGMRNAGDDMSDPFLLLNSDVISNIDVAGLLAHHRAMGGVGAMTLHEVDDPRPYGVAALDPTTRITRFVEKPKLEEAPSRWINAGVQVWRREVLERIPRGRPVSFETEVVPGLLPGGVYGFFSRGYWEDAGTPERLLRAQRLLFDGGRGGPGTLPPGSTGRGPVAFGDRIESRGAVFGPYVGVGARVKIGRGAHLENSVIMDDVDIGADAWVHSSLIGPGVRIAAGQRVDGQVLASEPSP